MDQEDSAIQECGNNNVGLDLTIDLFFEPLDTAHYFTIAKHKHTTMLCRRILW